jgi:hypothetical protein
MRLLNAIFALAVLAGLAMAAGAPVMEIVRHADGVTLISSAAPLDVTSVAVYSAPVYVGAWDLHSVQVNVYTTETVSIVAEIEGSYDQDSWKSMQPAVVIQTGTAATITTTLDAILTPIMDPVAFIRFRFDPDTVVPLSGYEVRTLRVLKQITGR